MKIRLLSALVGLAISFAVSTFAQQTSPQDPQLREQFVAYLKKFDDVWNSNDQAAWAALFTDDAIEVTHTGPIYGRANSSETLGRSETEFQQPHYHARSVFPSRNRYGWK
jgi:hypothetical protein